MYITVQYIPPGSYGICLWPDDVVGPLPCSTVKYGTYSSVKYITVQYIPPGSDGGCPWPDDVVGPLPRVLGHGAHVYPQPSLNTRFYNQEIKNVCFNLRTQSGTFVIFTVN